MDDKVKRCEDLAAKMRQDMIMLAGVMGGHVHWGGTLSCVDILAVLYGGVMNCAHKELPTSHRDKLLLSKGHASLTLYTALAGVGIISCEELMTFQKNGSALSEHAVMNDELGIECSTGSLGTGFPFGVGLAFAAKRKGLPYHVYAVIGDGECNEGVIWETILFARQQKLDNLTLVIDENGYQLDGPTCDILALDDLATKLEAFGWKTLKVDGHSVPELLEALTAPPEESKPTAVIARTVKGKGISFMEDDNTWHHKVLNKDLLEQARTEVGLE